MFLFLLMAAAMLALAVVGCFVARVVPEDAGSFILPEAPADPFADHRPGCDCTWHR